MALLKKSFMPFKIVTSNEIFRRLKEKIKKSFKIIRIPFYLIKPD